VGFVWKVEHRRAADDSLLMGYEYIYDLLGRVEMSVECQSGDTTKYAYTSAGRLASEVREGQVAYSRSYEYNLDCSRRADERQELGECGGLLACKQRAGSQSEYVNTANP